MANEKQNIIKTASDIFLKKGFHKTTVDEVASSMKISKKTIYKFFTSKDDLVKDALFFFFEDAQRKH